MNTSDGSRDVSPANPLAAPQAEWGVGRIRALHASRADWSRLHALPWGVPIEEWDASGVTTLLVRKGESRHPVIFIETGGRRYALKETSPEAARHEIAVLEELRQRGARTLEPAGWVVVAGEPIPMGEIGGRTVYTSGDSGYCITRLAERVLPQSILYRYPFTQANKHLLWSAIAELLLDLHEGGVFWGDPSLANVLIDLSGHRLTAVMADAETAQVVNGPLSEGLRRQDLDSFLESLAWQTEDIRIARGLPEEYQIVGEEDSAFFLSRYAGLRAERERRVALTGGLVRRLDLEHRIRRLNALGYGVLSMGSRLGRLSGIGARALGAALVPDGATPRTPAALLDAARASEADPAPALEAISDEPERAAGVAGAGDAGEYDLRIATLRTSWYVQRLRDLLGVRVPRPFARGLYRHINIHKWLMSEEAGHDVGMREAARDWYARYHRPMLAFLDALLPNTDARTRYATYVAILDHTWEMSTREHRAVPLEEGAVDYALALARDDADDAHDADPAAFVPIS